MNIPENEKIEGFEYGAHWSTPGRSGWYVRKSDGPWVQARSTPAPNELPDDYDEAYNKAVDALPKHEYVIEQYVRCIQRVIVTATSEADAIARYLCDGDGRPDGEPLEYIEWDDEVGIWPEGDDAELCEEVERLGVVLSRPHGHIPSIQSVVRVDNYDTAMDSPE